jgi:hypothetical protein
MPDLPHRERWQSNHPKTKKTAKGSGGFGGEFKAFLEVIECSLEEFFPREVPKPEQGPDYIHESDPQPCDGNNICMQTIKPEAVIDSIVRLLGSNSNVETSATSEQHNQGPVPSDGPDGSPLGLA